MNITKYFKILLRIFGGMLVTVTVMVLTVDIWGEADLVSLRFLGCCGIATLLGIYIGSYKSKIKRVNAKLDKEKQRLEIYSIQEEILEVNKQNIKARDTISVKKPLHFIGDKPLLVKLLIARYGCKKLKDFLCDEAIED